MADLSHWAYTSVFTGEQAAALILGIDPSDPHANLSRTLPVLEGMKRSYLEACLDSSSPLSERSRQLASQRLKARRAQGEEEGFCLRKEGAFEVQSFSGDEIARWLAANMKHSVYPFDSSQTDVGAQDGIDPADLPEELQAANIAFRAVSNGYGEKTATVKNRLIDYLKKHYPSLNSEAVQRIATVANPDKGRGRKKFYKE